MPDNTNKSTSENIGWDPDPSSVSPAIINAINMEIDMYRQSNNPLFLWSALSNIIMLHAHEKEDGQLVVRQEVTIPAEIADYLLRSAFSLTLLGWGQKQKIPITKDWTSKLREASLKTEEALKLVPRVLGLSGKPRRSAFSHLRSHQEMAAQALAYNALVGQGMKADVARQKAFKIFGAEKSDDREEKRVTIGRNFLRGVVKSVLFSKKNR